MAITKLNSLAIPPDTVVESDISFPLDSASFTGDLTVDADTLVVDSTNNRVGIGTTSPDSALHVVGDVNGAASSHGVRMGSDGTYARLELANTNGAFIDFCSGDGTDFDGRIIYSHSTDVLDFYTAKSLNMTLDSSGNVGIGKPPACPFNVASNDYVKVLVEDVSGTDTPFSIGSGVNACTIANNTSANTADEAITLNQINQSIIFTTAGAERMRLDNLGRLLFGKTSANVSGAIGFEILQDGWMASTVATSSDNSYHMYNLASNAYLFYVKGNGGINNVSGNNTNLSDQRSKKGIVDSGEWLNRLCQIPVRNFRYKHEDDSGKLHLGVISQEVEAVAPELVEKNSFEVNGEGRDSVYTGDLQFAMLKAIQEQQAMIETLQAQVAELQGAN